MLIGSLATEQRKGHISRLIGMKVIVIILIGAAVLFAISQLWAKGQIDDIEEYPYSIIHEYDEFEIRKYEEANFIYATMDADSYDQSSGKGFSILAGYIFGGNESKQKIAMTSPVVMDMNDSITMKFLVPAQYKIDDLPRPNSVEVKFLTEKERTLAAISFSGFASDYRIQQHKNKLFEMLDKRGIPHSSEWSFLGYDPPFKLIDRRNEVVVEVQL